MRMLVRGLHDVWCVVSHRCRISFGNDPLLETLQHHENDALRAARESRSRQASRARWSPTGNPISDRITGQNEEPR